MSDSIPEAEELLDEGHALVNSGLTHLRTVLAHEPIGMRALVAWHLCVQEWTTLALRPQWPTAEFMDEVVQNLEWLSDRLELKSPIDGKPYDFVTDAHNYKQ